MTELTITVYGLPASQGSKRAIVHRHTGKAVTMESSKRLAPWRQSVQWAAMDAVEDSTAGAWQPLDGPLTVGMTFTFPRPKSHFRTGRNAHLLRNAAPKYPAGPPDLSKLARAAEDALTDAGVWVDDARVVHYAPLTKVYVGDWRALDRPGVVITVARLSPFMTGWPA